MLLYILGIIILIGCIVFLCKGIGNETIEAIVATLLSVSILLTVILSVILLVNVGEEKRFDKEYNSLKYRIVTYDEKFDDMEYTNLRNILNDIVDINNTIETNKKYCDNIFIGCLYHKEIGEYEPIFFAHK